jgi:hypothetical protein
MEALLRNRGFIEKYRDAFRAHIAGMVNVVFPFGTFWMSKFGKVVCEVAEDAEAVLLGRSADPAPA